MYVCVCIMYVCFFERDVTQMNTRVSTPTHSSNVKLVAWLCIRRGTKAVRIDFWLESGHFDMFRG